VANSVQPAIGLLSGIRVLDFSIWRPGPYATQLLAELGADVVKVEPPGGDPMRAYPALFARINVNKRSIVLDLKSDTGQQRARELAAEADVAIEGYRPGVAARLGVGYDQLSAINPSLVYCSVSGMGQDGALALASGHDLNYQAWSGGLAPDGGVPKISPLPIADLAGGMAAAFAICAAVVRQLRTGEGEYIDVAMADVLATWTGAELPTATGVDPAARGVPGYGTFATADENFVALGVLTEDHFWRALCDALGIDAFRDLGFTDRMARLDELQATIAHAIRQRSRDELVTALLAVHVPVAPILDRAEMVQLEHFHERAVVTRDVHGHAMTGYPVRFATHPAARRADAPALDEHAGAEFSSGDRGPPSGTF
jgi:crotonobetainyl-CoA:carnitine CoA-transferase CaiB-like acyl-CoA transferase